MKKKQAKSDTNKSETVLFSRNKNLMPEKIDT